MIGTRKVKTVTVLGEAKSAHVSAQYIKVYCEECGSTWGISVREGQVTEKDLVCRNCITEKYWNEGKDI